MCFRPTATTFVFVTSLRMALCDLLQLSDEEDINRRDKVAQAVSMANAIQTNAWLSLATARRNPLFYNREFISACLQEVRTQTEG